MGISTLPRRGQNHHFPPKTQFCGLQITLYNCKRLSTTRKRLYTIAKDFLQLENHFPRSARKFAFYSTNQLHRTAVLDSVFCMAKVTNLLNSPTLRHPPQYKPLFRSNLRPDKCLPFFINSILTNRRELKG